MSQWEGALADFCLFSRYLEPKCDPIKILTNEILAEVPEEQILLFCIKEKSLQRETILNRMTRIEAELVKW